MDELNTSRVGDDVTARTCPAAAEQRAAHMAVLGVRRVLELCVGPSLAELERAYAVHGIRVMGNDIDRRWLEYNTRLGCRASWVVGDALEVPWCADAVVFAPPLSRGCTGRREDSLRVDEVRPGYLDFLARLTEESTVRVAVLVLPGRSRATRRDRAATHRLEAACASAGFDVDAVPLVCARGRVTKYLDLYLTRRV